MTITTIDYAYDPLYRLTDATYSNGDHYHYEYDEVGNRLIQDNTVNGVQVTTNYVYDDANRLSTVNGVTYTFDANGNLLNDGINTYNYDYANRLVSVDNGQSPVTGYVYNGLGDRLSQTVNGVTTNYTLDLNTGLTQVLSDGATDYLYGYGRIAQVNANTEYFLADALGSVRQMTDAAGTVTFAQSYDPYGVVTYTGGTSQTEFGFTGEQYGDSTQLIYLRARYYNPADGRFQSRDLFTGYIGQPQTQNRFSYTQNNPIRYIDPTGHYSWDAFLAEGRSLINDPVQHTLTQIQKNQSMPWECTDVGQIALWAAPAIAPLIIVAAIPMVIVSPDSAIDIASMAYDHYTGDYHAFALDAMGLMIPGVTGLGMLSHADEVYDAYRVFDNFDDIYSSAHAINTLDNTYDTAHYIDNIVDDVICLNSFSADTDVATSKGQVDISEIQIGDYVLAWNEATGKISFEQVTDTIHHTDEVVIHLTIDGEELETTPEHPFYVEGAGWVNAEDLQIGDDIRDADGKTGEVETIEAEQTSQEMYNLTVDEAHTFYVGNGQWLVHNICINGGVSIEDGLLRIKQLREAYPNAGGNMAFAIENVTSGDYIELISSSGKYIPGLNPELRNFPLPSMTQFEPLFYKGWLRNTDSEYMILEYIANKADVETYGTIKLFSELPICPSCENVIINQFSRKFPYIDLYFNSPPVIFK